MGVGIETIMEKDKVLTKEEQREVIKESFRQRDTDIEVIPITKVEKELLKETTEVVNVGLYTRVSTDSLEQAAFTEHNLLPYP